MFSVEGGGDSGKDDTSDKDMEEEEECKSSLLKKWTKMVDVEGRLVNQTSKSCLLHILFLVNTKIEDAIGKLSSSSSSPKWKRSPDDKVTKKGLLLLLYSIE